jgi:MFS family permease
VTQRPRQATAFFSVTRRGLSAAISGLPVNFWFLWTSTLINRLGSFVVTFLAIYLTTHRGYSASAVGFVAGLYGLGGIFSSILAGFLADLLGRRITLFVAQLSTAITTVLLGFVTSPVGVAVVACAVGLCSNASRPVVQAIMADLVPGREQRAKAFALNYWAINVGFCVSGVVGGELAEHGYLLLFAGVAATTLLAALLVFNRVPETRLPPTANADGYSAADEKTGFTYALRDVRFMALTVLAFMIASLLQQANTTLPVDMSRRGFSSADYGIVFALNGLLIVLLQIPVSHIVRKQPRRVVLPCAALLMGSGFGLYALAGSVAGYATATAVWTLGEMVIFPAAAAAVAEFAPARARGSYQGVYASALSAASLVAPLAGGWGLEEFGRTVVWLASAVIGIGAALGYGLLFGRSAQLAPSQAAR